MTAQRIWPGLALVAVVAACGGSDRAIVVEVRARPTVGDVDALVVEVANAGSTQMQTFDLGSHDFPATFSITTGGREGPIDISVRGTAGDATVAVGAVSVDAAASDAVLMLDPADFVVNTDYAGGQYVNQDIETNGFQVTAAGGVVTFGFRDDCPVNVCSQLGRRYRTDGLPQTTNLAAGTNQFRWNELDGMFAATVGVASQPDGSSIAVWDAPTGVACRAMTADGMAPAGVVTIAPDTNPDVVSATPLAGGKYAVTWAALDAMSNQVIRGTVVSPTCTTLVAPYTAAVPISFANRPTVGANGSATMIAWMENFNDARFRVGTAGGVFSPAGTIGSVLIAGVPDAIDFVRVAGSGNRFVVVYDRANQSVFTDAILMRRVDSTGAKIGQDTVIAADGVDYGAAAVAVRPTDGAIGVAWTQCEAGDGSGCGVYARVLRPSGVPVGDAILVNTTTAMDQNDPSIAALDDGFVVAFTDASATAPDIDMTGVRARFIYPAYDDAKMVLGAPCEGPQDCGADLVCGEDEDGALFCHLPCDPPGTGACPGGGTCAPDSYCKY